MEAEGNIESQIIVSPPKLLFFLLHIDYVVTEIITIKYTNYLSQTFVFKLLSLLNFMLTYFYINVALLL